jgi:hypothetical protein
MDNKYVEEAKEHLKDAESFISLNERNFDRALKIAAVKALVGAAEEMRDLNASLDIMLYHMGER